MFTAYSDRNTHIYVNGVRIFQMLGVCVCVNKISKNELTKCE